MKKLFIVFLFLGLISPSIIHAHEACDVDLNAPVTDSLYSTVFIRNWTSQAVTDTLTFSFADYRQRLQDSSAYFTKHGWQSFTKALEMSRILESVKENRQVLSATIKASPVIVEEGIKKPVTRKGQNSDILKEVWDLMKPEPANNETLEGEQAYFWTVEVPIVLTYQMGTKTRSDNLVVRLTIFRSSDPNNPDGIGINQWLASKG